MHRVNLSFFVVAVGLQEELLVFKDFYGKRKHCGKMLYHCSLAHFLCSRYSCTHSVWACRKTLAIYRIL